MPLCVQGHLAHQRVTAPRILQEGYAYGPMLALGGEAFCYERGTLVGLPNHASFLCAR